MLYKMQPPFPRSTTNCFRYINNINHSNDYYWKEHREEEEEERLAAGSLLTPPPSLPSLPSFTPCHPSFCVNGIIYLDWDELSNVYIHTGCICPAHSLTT